jgi:hypothetical protein
MPGVGQRQHRHLQHAAGQRRVEVRAGQRGHPGQRQRGRRELAQPPLDQRRDVGRARQPRAVAVPACRTAVVPDQRLQRLEREHRVAAGGLPEFHRQRVGIQAWQGQGIQQRAHAIAVQRRQRHRHQPAGVEQRVGELRQRGQALGGAPGQAPAQRVEPRVLDQRRQRLHAGRVGEMQVVHGQAGQTVPGRARQRLRGAGGHPGAVAPRGVARAFGQDRGQSVGQRLQRAGMGLAQRAQPARQRAVGHTGIARAAAEAADAGGTGGMFGQQTGLPQPRLADEHHHAPLGPGGGQLRQLALAPDQAGRPQHRHRHARRRQRRDGLRQGGLQRLQLGGGRHAEFGAQLRLAAHCCIGRLAQAAGEVQGLDLPQVGRLAQRIAGQQAAHGLQRTVGVAGGEVGIDALQRRRELPLGVFRPGLCEPVVEGGAVVVGPLAQQRSVATAAVVQDPAVGQAQGVAALDQRRRRAAAQLEQQLAQAVAGGILPSGGPEQVGQQLPRQRAPQCQPRQHGRGLALQRVPARTDAQRRRAVQAQAARGVGGHDVGVQGVMMPWSLMPGAWMPPAAAAQAADRHAPRPGAGAAPAAARR